MTSSQTFSYTGLVNTFTPISGVTTYTIVAIGGGGGGGSNTAVGGSGAKVTTTVTGITEQLTIIVGGGGGSNFYIDNNRSAGGGGGLTEIFSSQVNIIAGGGGGAGSGTLDIGGASLQEGADGGSALNQKGRGGNGSSGGSGGTGTGVTGGNGGNYLANGQDNTGGGGGGGAKNGIITTGGSTSSASATAPKGFNGGGEGHISTAGTGGGGAGYGGGGGGGIEIVGGGGGGGGSSYVLTFQANYETAGNGGAVNSPGGDGSVTITWTDPTPTPTPTPNPNDNNGNNAISNICFPAGTPIQTDQGLINIENIDTKVNTISNKKIEHITKTVTLDKHLICFSPSSLGYNIPSRNTVMSRDHKILYRGKMAEAFRFLNMPGSTVKQVKYNGEILYNILLEDKQQGLVNVNGIMCETLHPENMIAKLYKSNYSKSYKDNVVFLMNESLIKKDLKAYKSIVGRL
jgi:hypothetical protein